MVDHTFVYIYKICALQNIYSYSCRNIETMKIFKWDGQTDHIALKLLGTTLNRTNIKL